VRAWTDGEPAKLLVSVSDTGPGVAPQVRDRILANDSLYLKVDDSNREQYEAEGMTAFQPYTGKPTTMSYYQVPARVLEDGEELTAWARASVRVAVRAIRRRTRR
jgi:DNA transformation protein